MPLLASVVLDSAEDDSAGASIILALYDASGKMVAYKGATQAVAAGGTLTRLEVSMGVGEIPASAAKAKAFVWSSGYIPLRASQSTDL
jgi:hypothetical protein